VHRTLYILGLICFICCIIYGQQEKSIKQIKQEFDSKKLDMSKIYNTANELSNCQITSVEDLSDVAEISESIMNYLEDNKSVFKSDRDYFFDYNEITNFCYSSFSKIQEKDKHLESKLLELMKEGEDETRLYAIKALGIIKSKKAAPELRKKVKGFSRTKYKALGFVSEISAYKYILEASEAAEALGSVAEEKDFQLLVDRLYDIEGATGRGLLKIGKKGFDALLNMARKEIKERDDEEWYASRALDGAHSLEYVPEWIKIYDNQNENERIRYWAFLVIVDFRDENSNAENLIERLKSVYESLSYYEKIDLVTKLNKSKDVPFLLSVLNKEEKENILTYLIGNLSSIGTNLDDPSAVISALEKIIYNHGNKEVRDRAKNALICFGEKESLLRLEKYLIETDDDKIFIEQVRKRIKSGRKGPHYYDKYTEEEYNFHRGGGKK